MPKQKPASKAIKKHTEIFIHIRKSTVLLIAGVPIILVLFAVGTLAIIQSFFIFLVPENINAIDPGLKVVMLSAGSFFLGALAFTGAFALLDWIGKKL